MLTKESEKFLVAEKALRDIREKLSNLPWNPEYDLFCIDLLTKIDTVFRDLEKIDKQK